MYDKQAWLEQQKEYYMEFLNCDELTAEEYAERDLFDSEFDWADLSEYEDAIIEDREEL
jgi:hypothetical protein|tara:strand:- start:90 stop:266 length:177 start_codon:yes stop_codon:yes gene_type:complete